MKFKKLFRPLSEKPGSEESGEELSLLFGSEIELNRYYSAVSAVCRVLEFGFLFALILFTVSSAVFNRDAVRTDTVKNVIKNFTFRLDKDSSPSPEIIYEPDSLQSFALFGKGLAVSGNSGIRLFSASGRNTFKYDFYYSSSRLKASSGIAAVYDFGGNEYMIFNTFSRVGRGTVEDSIYGMSVADSGAYILLTGDAEYASSVMLFRSDLSLKTRYRKNSYVVSSEISRDGDGLLITTLDVNSSGQYLTAIERYNAGSDTPEATVELTGIFPYGCFFTSDGFGLLASDRILFYTPGGALKRSLSFGGLEAVLYDVSGDTAGIILKETGTGLSVNYYLLLAVADDLRPTEPVKLDHTPVSLSVRDFAAYVLSEERLDEYTADGKSTSIDVTNRPEGSAVLAYEKGKVYYLSKSSAFVIEFGDK